MIQREKRVGNIKGTRQPIEVRKEKEEKQLKRDFRDRSASSRALRYQRFAVRTQEHSSTVHGRGSIELSNQDRIEYELNAALNFKVQKHKGQSKLARSWEYSKIP